MRKRGQEHQASTKERRRENKVQDVGETGGRERKSQMGGGMREV